VYCAIGYAYGEMSLGYSEPGDGPTIEWDEDVSPFRRVGEGIALIRKSGPAVVALAGANGAGKSTTGPVLLRDTLGITEFVNADVIAQGLSAFDPEGAAIAAGRVMLARLRELADRRVDFGFETTLAGRAYAGWIIERCISNRNL
jgi:hypothetical protein